MKYWDATEVALQVNGNDSRVDISDWDVQYESTITWSLVSEAIE
ncbi:hypothetical protein A5886_001002 [Enterococcus sp. 8G7_MSG3316]|uniref:Uncharacterized protein n=1 Tax=Candidatus Enterococcus testudinis TaxID=1834191 RepID=A0A242A4G4_9ENTE|nr:hypothetical protein [Enterococcus sp. 8G7_MSG3316]OTN75926.1 hypothetical protein A5886_001002 [Enterococcus sp. 8G7_MSG3316]